jgi:hypothetical protein
MQGHRVRAWMAIGALLAFAGCNTQPAPAPVTVPVTAPVPEAAVVAGSDPTVLLRQYQSGILWETHHSVKTSDVMTWKAHRCFSVRFDPPPKNPCKPNGSGDPNIYPAINVSGTLWVAQCTLITTAKGKAYGYEVDPPFNVASCPAKPPTKHVTPCQGCSVEIDPD